MGLLLIFQFVLFLRHNKSVTYLVQFLTKCVRVEGGVKGAMSTQSPGHDPDDHRINTKLVASRYHKGTETYHENIKEYLILPLKKEQPEANEFATPRQL